jgi:exopolysaccharide biosynthesis protein
MSNQHFRESSRRKNTAKQVTTARVLRILGKIAIAAVVAVMVPVVGLFLILGQIFNGPSVTARNVLTMSLLEPSGTKWIPPIFLSDEVLDEIKNGSSGSELPDIFNPGMIQINTGNSLSNSDEWKNHPDGVRIERISGSTFDAHIMIIRDPSKVYMATSTENFSKDIPGLRITEAIEREGAIAAINAGAFYDNGTSNPVVGSVPEGLVIAGGKVVWNRVEMGVPENGFVGFNKDNVLVVAHSMTANKAMELNIRDGCCFGPVLIMNGQVNEKVYNGNSGWNPRTAIGQRADGAVIFVCIDGRQANSLGGTYRDVINIMQEYGAVNACNLDGGSSSVMLYRDNQGLYGEAGKVQMINNYSVLQAEPRRMPNFFMVAPSKEG